MATQVFVKTEDNQTIAVDLHEKKTSMDAFLKLICEKANIKNVESATIDLIIETGGDEYSARLDNTGKIVLKDDGGFWVSQSGVFGRNDSMEFKLKVSPKPSAMMSNEIEVLLDVDKTLISLDGKINQNLIDVLKIFGVTHVTLVTRMNIDPALSLKGALRKELQDLLAAQGIAVSKILTIFDVINEKNLKDTKDYVSLSDNGTVYTTKMLPVEEAIIAVKETGYFNEKNVPEKIDTNKFKVFKELYSYVKIFNLTEDVFYQTKSYLKEVASNLKHFLANENEIRKHYENKKNVNQDLTNMEKIIASEKEIRERFESDEAYRNFPDRLLAAIRFIPEDVLNKIFLLYKAHADYLAWVQPIEKRIQKRGATVQGNQIPYYTKGDIFIQIKKSNANYVFVDDSKDEQQDMREKSGSNMLILYPSEMKDSFMGESYISLTTLVRELATMFDNRFKIAPETVSILIRFAETELLQDKIKDSYRLFMMAQSIARCTLHVTNDDKLSISKSLAIGNAMRALRDILKLLKRDDDTGLLPSAFKTGALQGFYRFHNRNVGLHKDAVAKVQTVVDDQLRLVKTYPNEQVREKFYQECRALLKKTIDESKCIRLKNDLENMMPKAAPSQQDEKTGMSN